MTKSEACVVRKRMTKYSLFNFVACGKGIPSKDHDGVMFE